MGKSYHLYLTLILLLLSFSNLQARGSFQDGVFFYEIKSDTGNLFSDTNNDSFFSSASEPGRMMESSSVGLQQLRVPNYHWKPAFLLKHTPTYIIPQTTDSYAVSKKLLSIERSKDFYLYFLQRIII